MTILLLALRSLLLTKETINAGVGDSSRGRNKYRDVFYGRRNMNRNPVTGAVGEIVHPEVRFQPTIGKLLYVYLFNNKKVMRKYVYLTINAKFISTLSLLDGCQTFVQIERQFSFMII